MRVGSGVLRIRTAHSTRVVGGSTSGTMGSCGVGTSVDCGGGDVESLKVGFGGGSAKSKWTGWYSPEFLESRAYLRRLVVDLLAAIRYPLAELRPKLPPPHPTPSV